MKSYVRPRLTLYRCDFCKKHGTKARIGKHEPQCFGNPDRICAVCQNEGRVEVGYDGCPRPHPRWDDGAWIPEGVATCPYCVAYHLHLAGIYFQMTKNLGCLPTIENVGGLSITIPSYFPGSIKDYVDSLYKEHRLGYPTE